ncbi:MAG: PP2C family protein-serine/threonine phosphatase, partial [Flavobacteriales bacterium]
NTLNQIMAETDEVLPAKIMDMLNEGISQTLHQGSTDVKDGMDAAMCAIDFKKKEVHFAGAYNPLYLIRNGTLQQIKGDKFPIGAFIDDEEHLFTDHTLKIEKGDTLYIFSDGYADQFGGKRGKKFMYRNFRDLLIKIQDKEMEEQKRILDETVEDWRGDLEQVDDILIIGLRIE